MFISPRNLSLFEAGADLVLWAPSQPFSGDIWSLGVGDLLPHLQPGQLHPLPVMQLCLSFPNKF